MSNQMTQIAPEISLRSGAIFNLIAPKPDTVEISDIAHALANLCRFTGHVHRFYSVAEHSVHASRIVTPAHALEALLHDAAEAYVGDVSAPLKSLLPEYRRIERRVDRVVRARYGLPANMSSPVHVADLRMLRAEQLQALQCLRGWPHIEHLEPAEVTLQFWAPDHARAEFLRRFAELTRTEAT